MLLKLAGEIFVLCAAFIGMIFAFVVKDRLGGIHWYPKMVQREAVVRGLVSEKYIAKRRKQTQLMGLPIIALIVLGSVFYINGAHGWWNAAWQIYFMLFVMNLFDAVFVDWIWVRKTTYWVIPELVDLDIGKPLDYLIKERVCAAIVYLPIAALVGCAALIL